MRNSDFICAMVSAAAAGIVKMRPVPYLSVPHWPGRETRRRSRDSNQRKIWPTGERKGEERKRTENTGKRACTRRGSLIRTHNFAGGGRIRRRMGLEEGGGGCLLVHPLCADSLVHPHRTHLLHARRRRRRRSPRRRRRCSRRVLGPRRGNFGQGSDGHGSDAPPAVGSAG